MNFDNAVLKNGAMSAMINSEWGVVGRGSTMQYRYGFVARAADVMPDGSFAVLGGGVNYVVFQQLPATYNLAIITSFNLDAADYGREHRIRLEVCDPAGVSVFALDGTGFPEKNDDFPGAALDFMFVFNVTNFLFIEPGEYRFRISVDGRESGCISLLTKRKGAGR